MPNRSETIGLIMWAMIILTLLILRRVSRNKGARSSTPSAEGTGPKWEQDEPYVLSMDDDDFDPIFPEEED